MLVACGSPPPAHPVAPGWQTLESQTHESLRGLGVGRDASIWASGSHGAVVRSVDGVTFTAITIPDAAALDFRSLHAIDADHAIVLSAGSPARAFLTSDGGVHWQETFTREGEGVFYDSIALDGGEGLAIGDPIEGRFALIVTHDAGATWEEATGPMANEGEAAFAASNGCLARAGSHWLFASSGRVFRSHGSDWSGAVVPIVSSASAGLFAIAFRDPSIGFVVGGDYEAPTAEGFFARTSDGGRSWQAGSAPRGYRSSIAVAPNALIVVGTSGSDVSYDDGGSWSAIDDAPMNAVRVAGAFAYAVGADGRIARLSL